MTEGWRYVLSQHALRDMRRLTLSARQRIFEALDLYVAERRGDVLKLQGREDEWRLRVGDRRVLFQPNFQDRVVVVLRVLPRGRAYRR
jgi:mRNA-degrading endonuclease RelE of RelBE toxin-antitoxin system